MDGGLGYPRGLTNLEIDVLELISPFLLVPLSVSTRKEVIILEDHIVGKE
jgi:hypothetical protein